MSNWLQTLLTNLISGGVIAAIATIVLGVVFGRQRAQIDERVRLEFAKLRAVEEARQGWKIRAISELFAPMIAHLDRSQNCFHRYTGVPSLAEARSDSDQLKRRNEQLFLEVLMKSINESARNLLLEKFFLLPPTLRKSAGELITHYDRWLEIYDSMRTQRPPEEWSGFVFAGTDRQYEVRFPKDAENALRKTFDDLWAEIYEAEAKR